MKKFTKKEGKIKIANYPIENDPFWNDECEKILPYCYGKGIDIGSGSRTPIAGQIRVDLDPETHPDVCASADNMPVEDNLFDYLTALHCLEHLKDTTKTLKEWLRVIKPGGFILIVVPDREYTASRSCGPQKPMGKNLMLHQNEYNLEEICDILQENQKLGFTLVDYGPAGSEWSNYAVLRKII